MYLLTKLLYVVLHCYFNISYLQTSTCKRNLWRYMSLWAQSASMHYAKISWWRVYQSFACTEIRRMCMHLSNSVRDGRETYFPKSWLVPLSYPFKTFPICSWGWIVSFTIITGDADENSIYFWGFNNAKCSTWSAWLQKGYRPHLHVVHSFVVLALGHMVRHMYTVSQSLIGRWSCVLISE